MTTLRELHLKVFDERCIRIRANPSIMITVRDEEFEMPERHNVSEIGDWQGITCTVESSSESHILNLLRGAPGLTGDDEVDDANLKRLTEYGATVNECVEVFDLTEEIRFYDGQGMVDLYHILSEYAALLSHKAQYSPHHQHSPQEDLDKMYNLINLLEEPVARIESEGAFTGDTDIAKFFGGIMSMVSVGTDKELVVRKSTPDIDNLFRR